MRRLRREHFSRGLSCPTSSSHNRTRHIKEDKAGVALKSCKANCLWKKRKNDLVTAAKKKARDSCSKGEAPDINEISKGLDTDAKTKLKNLYNQNSRMFDGTAKLPDKDFEPVPSRQAATLTGRGGQVADLKTSEPGINKTPTEFSLSGKKLSGETASPPTPKQSTTLLTSAAPARTSADTTPASSAKPSAETASAAAVADAGSAQPAAIAAPGIVIPDINPDDFKDKKEFCAQLPSLISQLETMKADLTAKVADAETTCGQMPNPQAQAACRLALVQMRGDLLRIDALIQQVKGYKKIYCPLSWFEGSWFKRNIVLPVITSKLAEWLFPVATRLLNHAKNGEGITWDDEILIANKVKNTEKWQEEFMGDANADKIRKQMKGENEIQLFKSFKFETSDDRDLYYGLHDVEVWGKRSGDDILIYIRDPYNFDTGGGFLINVGKKGMEEGWLTGYDIVVPIMVI